VKPAAPLFPLLLAAAAAAGCAVAAGVADPPLAQLARWRTAGRDAIAAEPIVAPCPDDHPACPRLHALRAEACLGRALADRAPGAACPASRAAPLLDCAAEGYAAALASPGAAPPTPATLASPSAAAAAAAAAPAALRAGLAQALLCRAELDAPEPAAARRAAAAAEAAEGAPPALAALHGARAALLLVRVGPVSGRCAAARRALELSAAAPDAHRARLRADADAALLHLRTCEPPR
jgi:hypothetical protein